MAPTVPKSATSMGKIKAKGVDTKSKDKVVNSKVAKSKVPKPKQTIKRVDENGIRLKHASWSGTPPVLPSGLPMSDRLWNDALHRAHTRVYNRAGYRKEQEKRKNGDHSGMDRAECVQAMKERRPEIRANAIKGLKLGSDVGLDKFKVLAADYADLDA